MKWSVNPKTTALIVVDMQNDFVLEGAIMEIPEARKQLDKIKELIEFCRSKKIPVLYSKHETDPKICALEVAAFAHLSKAGMRRGSFGIEIVDELKPVEGDFIVVKNRFSAFFNTNLETILKGLNIETLIICGTVTNICCESTARDAFFRDYKVIFGSDVCSALTKEEHTASLKNMQIFGEVLALEKIKEVLTGG